MKLKFFQKSSFNIVQKTICVLVVLLMAGILETQLFDFLPQLEYWWQGRMIDARNSSVAMRKFAGSGKVNEITLILIDDNSLKKMNLTWPISRSIYARLIEKVNKYKPKVIAIDITFEERSPDAKGDMMFARTLKKKESENVILGCRTILDDNSMVKKVINPDNIFIDGWTPNRKKENIGFVDSAEQKKKDGCIRHTRNIFKMGDKTFYSFDALIIAKFLGIPSSDIKDFKEQGYQQIGNIIIPVDSSGAMMINYIGQIFWGGTAFQIHEGSRFQPCDGVPYDGINIISLYDVFNRDKERLFKAYFHNKIILLGVSAEQEDRQMTPIGFITGPEVHVDILLSILHQKFLREAGMWEIIFIVTIPSLVLVFILFNLTPLGGFIVSSLFAIAMFKYSSWNFQENGVVNYYFSSLLAICLTYVFITVYGHIIVHKYQARLKNILLELAPVPEPVLDRIMERYKGKIVLGGEKVNLTVLFSDIRGYTALSQNLDPREVMATLNEYYTAMAQIYKQYGGMNFDIMGDGQMIVFGAEESSRKDHAFMAVKSSIKMLERLEQLNESWNAQNRKTISIGIGINTGDVSLGFLGSDHAGYRKQFAAIGDTTNLAARIESLTKTMNATVIISESTYELTKDLIVAEELPPTKVKGKDEPIKIYKLVDLKDKVGARNVE